MPMHIYNVYIIRLKEYIENTLQGLFVHLVIYQIFQNVCGDVVVEFLLLHIL